MKRNLDMGVEVYDNKAKKKQRHTTNEKPNMYLDIFNKNTNILIRNTDLHHDNNNNNNYNNCFDDGRNKLGLGVWELVNNADR